MKQKRMTRAEVMVVLDLPMPTADRVYNALLERGLILGPPREVKTMTAAERQHARSGVVHWTWPPGAPMGRPDAWGREALCRQEILCKEPLPLKIAEQHSDVTCRNCLRRMAKGVRETVDEIHDQILARTTPEARWHQDILAWRRDHE